MARTHGKPGTYTAGCRCDECREAWRDYRADRPRPFSLASWRENTPHTHTQFNDRTADEPICRADEHHWPEWDESLDDDDTPVCCTRCGISSEDV